MKPPALVLLGLLACHTHSQPPTPPDDAAADVAADSAPASLPPGGCAAVGCAALPECPGTCQSVCGCCPCGPGVQLCAGSEGKRALQTCGASGGCWEYTDCPPDATCLEYAPGKAACVSSSADCGRVEAAYVMEAQKDALITANAGAAPVTLPDRRCIPNGCNVVAGHCSLGLGACWYVGYPDPARLEALAQLWQRLGCAREATCDCPPLPAGAECSAAAGSCVVR